MLGRVAAHLLDWAGVFAVLNRDESASRLVKKDRCNSSVLEIRHHSELFVINLLRNRETRNQFSESRREPAGVSERQSAKRLEAPMVRSPQGQGSA